MVTVWSQGEAAVTEKGERQACVGAYPVDAGVGGLGGLVDAVGAEVGQLGALDVAPERLDRVEVGGVTGEPFDDQPAPLGADERLHLAAAMRRQPVPDQSHLGAV